MMHTSGKIDVLFLELPLLLAVEEVSEDLDNEGTRPRGIVCRVFRGGSASFLLCSHFNNLLPAISSVRLFVNF